MGDAKLLLAGGVLRASGTAGGCLAKRVSLAICKTWCVLWEAEPELLEGADAFGAALAGGNAFAGTAFACPFSQAF